MVSPRSCKFFTNQLRKDYFLFKTDKPSKIGTAECGSCQPLYIIYRLAWMLFWIGVFIYDVIDEPNRHLFMTFLTNWSYMAVGVSSILQFIASVYGAVHARSLVSSRDTPALYRINWAIYSFASSATVMVSILYWVIIYEGEDQHFTNYATHAVNTAYVIIDIFITGVPFRILHFWIPEIFGIAYVIFSIVYWAITNNIVYDALDYEDNLWGAIAYIVGALVATPIIHFVLFFFYWIRAVIYDSCSCCGQQQEDNSFDNFDEDFDDRKYATRIQLA